MKYKDFQKKVGEKITYYRELKGFTSEELGRICDIDKSALIDIEKGYGNITVSTIIEIADALQIKPKDLVDV